MKIKCSKCGKFVHTLDLRKSENKNESHTHCKSCLEANLKFSRQLINNENS